MNDSSMPQMPFADLATATQRWTQLLDVLRDGGHLVLDDPRVSTPELRAEGLRYLLRILVGSTLTGIEIADPDYPRLFRLYDTYHQWGLANPDCVYLFCRVSPEHTYRIHGKRGGAHVFDLQICDSHLLRYPDFNQLLTRHDLEADADGNIEIFLGGEPRSGNWMPLGDGAGWFFLRQYFYDWETEAPADLVVERIGAHYPPLPVTPAQIAERLDLVERHMSVGLGTMKKMIERFYQAPENRVTFNSDAQGMHGISYGVGHYVCQADEVVIVEVKPPSCLYWSFHLVSQFWESFDWDLRQTSLNGHQAMLDDDGVFRAVIAQRDPGVPNWMDASGHVSGLIGGRWLRADAWPSATLRTVPLAQLRQHLPATTPCITPQQRSEQLRRRMIGVARRFRE